MKKNNAMFDGISYHLGMNKDDITKDDALEAIIELYLQGESLEASFYATCFEVHFCVDFPKTVRQFIGITKIEKDCIVEYFNMARIH